MTDDILTLLVQYNSIVTFQCSVQVLNGVCPLFLLISRVFNATRTNYSITERMVCNMGTKGR